MEERSSRASLVAGFRIYLEHFRRIFKSTWLTALVASLLSGAAATAVFIYWPELIARVYSDLANAWQYAGEYKLLLAVIAALILLSAVATAVFEGSAAAAILNIHLPQPVKRLPMMLRAVKKLLWNVLLCGIGYGLVGVFIYWKRAMFFDPMHNIVPIVTTLILLALVSIVLLPTAYISVKYLMDRSTRFWPLLFKQYPTSMRYWGRQFVVILVCLILLGIFTLVVSLPGIILYEANWQAHIGVVGGDPLGMPGHMTALTFITCSVIAFLQLYIWLPLLTSLYYVYGAIDTRETKKKNLQTISSQQA